jgi:hypothetical protein
MTKVDRERCEPEDKVWASCSKIFISSWLNDSFDREAFRKFVVTAHTSKEPTSHISDVKLDKQFQHEIVLGPPERRRWTGTVNTWLLLKIQALVAGASQIWTSRPGTLATRAPGQTVDRLAEFIFSGKAYRTVFSQLVLDFREEYFECLQSNRPWKLCWVWLSWHGYYLLTAVFHLKMSVIKRVIEVWKLIG